MMHSRPFSALLNGFGLEFPGFLLLMGVLERVPFREPILGIVDELSSISLIRVRGCLINRFGALNVPRYLHILNLTTLEHF